MTSLHIEKYLKNCFILLIPVLIWNVLFASKLPVEYQPTTWDNVPRFLLIAENLFRISVFALPLIMVLSLKQKVQQVGFVLYLIGVFIYFFSWAAQVTFPDNFWSTSMAGFMAPVYTPLIFMTGIGLIGQQSTAFKIKNLPVIYILLAILFTIVHTWHAFMVFCDVRTN